MPRFPKDSQAASLQSAWMAPISHQLAVQLRFAALKGFQESARLSSGLQHACRREEVCSVYSDPCHSAGTRVAQLTQICWVRQQDSIVMRVMRSIEA
eukprot:scaffold244481_cov43-Prasinocladus_malaysianus.AAC.1